MNKQEGCKYPEDRVINEGQMTPDSCRAPKNTPGYLGNYGFLKFCISPSPHWNHIKDISDRAEILIISNCSQNNPVAKISAKSVYTKGYF
jgi:hypothetical protein